MYREYDEAKSKWILERNELWKLLEHRDRDVHEDFVGRLSQENIKDNLFSSTSSDSMARENHILKTIKQNLESEVLLSVNKEKLLQQNIENLTIERNELKQKLQENKKGVSSLEEALRETERKGKEEIFSLRKQIIDLQSDLKCLEDENKENKLAAQKRYELEDRLEAVERKKVLYEQEVQEKMKLSQLKIDELNEQLQMMKRLNTEFKQKINQSEGEFANHYETIEKVRTLSKSYFLERTHNA
jgi:hypothetical protein